MSLNRLFESIKQVLLPCLCVHLISSHLLVKEHISVYYFVRSWVILTAWDLFDMFSFIVATNLNHI